MSWMRSRTSSAAVAGFEEGRAVFWVLVAFSEASLFIKRPVCSCSAIYARVLKRCTQLLNGALQSHSRGPDREKVYVSRAKKFLCGFCGAP